MTLTDNLEAEATHNALLKPETVAATVCHTTVHWARQSRTHAVASRLAAMSGAGILPHQQSTFRRHVVCIIERSIWRHEIILVVYFTGTVVDRGTVLESHFYRDPCTWKTNIVALGGFPFQISVRPYATRTRRRWPPDHSVHISEGWMP